jgi:hypothetical protein
LPVLGVAFPALAWTQEGLTAFVEKRKADFDPNEPFPAIISSQCGLARIVEVLVYTDPLFVRFGKGVVGEVLVHDHVLPLLAQGQDEP